jgi:hypothetical protein
MSQLSMFDEAAAVVLPPPSVKSKTRGLNREDRAIGRALAEQGADRALDAADALHEGWKVAAMSFFLEFAANHVGAFATEDVRHAAAGRVPEPKNARCWGGIVTQARKAGHIKFAGYAASKDPKSHCAPSNLWVRA